MTKKMSAGIHVGRDVRCIVTTLDTLGVNVETHASRRAFIEHWLKNNLYEGDFNSAKLIAWLESLKPVIDNTVARLKTEDADEGC